MPDCNSKKSKILPFSVIKEKLDPLVKTLENLLNREFPENLSSISGLQPFLLAAFYTAENTYQAIKYIAADLPKDPSRRLEFGLVISPLGRLLADILFTIVFMKEDLGSRVIWYHKGGWRELKEGFERHRSKYAASAEWQEWLKQFEVLLEFQRKTLGISEKEADNSKKLLPYWPIPGQMLKDKNLLSDETEEFLQFLNDWVYKELSADTHMSAAGIMRRYGFLLLEKEEERQKFLSTLKSNGIFTSTTLLVAICTEINDVCRYGREEKLSYLWGILVGFWGEAKDLFERRYKGKLAAI